MNKQKNLILVALACCLALPFAAQAQTIKIATIAPESSSWMKDMKAGAKSIEDHTEGRVRLKFYGGGVQGNAKQVQRKMRTGQLHGGAFASGELGLFQKDADILALPMLFNSIEEARFVRKDVEPEIRQRMEDAGYVNFGLAAAGFAYMMTKEPAKTMDDLAGRKVWLPDGDQAGFAALKALGVAPVVMPITDVMTGLQTELLDSVGSPPVGAVVFQWHTRVNYITEVPLAYIYACLLIDKRVFNKVSPEDQEVVREVMEGIYRKFDKYGVSDNEEAMQALLDSGLEVVVPDDADVAEWRRVVSQSNREISAAGTFDLDLYERIQSLLADYRSGDTAAP